MVVQQIEVLLPLESRLQTAVDAATAHHDDVVARLDESRRMLERLLAHEAQETNLYIESTRLEMRAMRDVVHLEMDSARREIARFLDDAKRNVTRACRERDAQHRELETKLRLATERKKQRECERRAEIVAVKQEAARLREAAAKAADTRSLPVLKTAPHGEVETAQANHHRGGDHTWLLLPVVLSVVAAACLRAVYAKVRMRRATERQRQRVLYSAQLKRHFSNQDGFSTPREDGDAETSRMRLKSVESGGGPRMPTLHRRLRPAWSPAASTASTVSTPDTPSARSSVDAASPRL